MTMMVMMMIMIKVRHLVVSYFNVKLQEKIGQGSYTTL